MFLKIKIQGFSLILAQFMMLIIITSSIFLIGRTLPFARKTAGIEQGAQSYYSAVSGAERALINADLGEGEGNYTKDSVDDTNEKYSSSFQTQGQYFPFSGEGDSTYDSDYNILSKDKIIQIRLMGDINLKNAKIYVRIPDIDNNGVFDERINAYDPILPGGTSSGNEIYNKDNEGFLEQEQMPLIFWTLSSNFWPDNDSPNYMLFPVDVDGNSTWDFQGDERPFFHIFEINNIMNALKDSIWIDYLSFSDEKRWKTIDPEINDDFCADDDQDCKDNDEGRISVSDFYNDYMNNSDKCSKEGNECILTLSLMEEIYVTIDGKEYRAPFLEYKIDWGGNINQPSSSVYIESQGEYNGFSRSISESFSQKTISQGFDATIFN